jgi:hypothetical protein
MLSRDSVVDNLLRLLADRREAQRTAVARQRAFTSFAYAIIRDAEYATWTPVRRVAKPLPALCDREAA